jgi:antibiotic biosynthesis monooxygenase (ABM) superfamily enzyme
MILNLLIVRLTTTLLAWLFAFLAVLTLLTVFGDEISSLPLALRALLISGLLVFLMANLVMPVLSRALGRWLIKPGRPASHRSRSQ